MYSQIELHSILKFNKRKGCKKVRACKCVKKKNSYFTLFFSSVFRWHIGHGLNSITSNKEKNYQLKMKFN